MAQITIYLPDDLEKKARNAAKAHRKTVSRWIADQVVQTLEDRWAKGVLAAAGALADFPDLQVIRKGYGRDITQGVIRLILLDTNTVIFYLKGVEPVVARLEASSPREVAIPSVVAYELEYGTLKTTSPRRRAVISELLAGLAQVPFDAEAALEAAHIRVELESRGHVIGPLDLLIAGTALSRGAVLVTSNTKEFSRVKSLRLSDWTKPSR